MVKLLTGNDLLRGHVLWWDGAGWSPDLRAAAPLDKAEGEAILARESAHERLCDLALVDAEPSVAGGFRPTHIRERIRSFGPTVRADLALANQEWR